LYDEAVRTLETASLLGKDRVINHTEGLYFEKDSKAGRPKGIVAEVMDYIRQNYHKDLTLKLLAELFYLNPLYLGQIFKKDTGESFNDFLARVRIENAVRLLKNTNLKVYEIAEKVGFKELQYYYKTFKSITGASPTAFRTND
jgi:Response regulator containing CheY-like receiver domain and AraC-type DNA-binding domain